MKRLWDFINQFPRAGPRTTLRRIPAWVREDLEWWSKLLPTYNGVLFFHTTKRNIQTLYTDAYLYGLGGFNFEGSQPWKQAYISQLQACCIIVQEKAPPAHRKMKKNLDDPNINVYKVEAILLAFQAWASK